MTKSSLYKVSAAILLSASTVAVTAAAETPTVEEMWKLIQQQQKEIETLKADAAKRDNQFLVVEERLDYTADAVELVAEMAPAVGNSGGNTTLGGYGEMHYNNLEDQNGDGDKTELDFHRL